MFTKFEFVSKNSILSKNIEHSKQFVSHGNGNSLSMAQTNLDVRLCSVAAETSGHTTKTSTVTETAVP